MRCHRSWSVGVLLGIGFLVTNRPAAAVITRLTPLREVLASEQLIFTAKVEKLDPEKPVVVLNVDEDLKGKAPFRRMPVNLTADSEGKKEQHTAKLLKRLAAGLPLVVFTSKSDKRYTAFGYTNGTWFQMIGNPEKDPATVRWSFTHCEPYLRRTFKGTTAELRQVIIDGLANKKKPPEPNPKEEPGLGPEVQQEPSPKQTEDGQGNNSRSATTHHTPHTTHHSPLTTHHSPLTTHQGPVFAVIPTFIILGPLALLASLFGFGGLTLFLKRWMVALSLGCIYSTLLLLRGWFGGYLAATWWGTPLALWLVFLLVALTGLVWSAQRRRAAVRNGQAEAMLPGRGDEILLKLLSVAGLVVTFYALGKGVLFTSPWMETGLLSAAIWVGTVHAMYMRGRRPAAVSNVSSEETLLGVVVLGCGLLAVMPLTHDPARAIEAVDPGERQFAAPGRKPVGVAWIFEAMDRGRIVSSPLVVGDRVYTAAEHRAGFRTYGTVYCLDRATGKIAWKFNDDERMKPVFSSPCLADGRLYIGEGFHQDSDCKLYCLRADSGKKLWDFPTKSHTESSPWVVEGRVYFGAGEDGVYCLDAATGKLVWHFDGLHVDTSPALAGNCLYGGSGYGRQEIFCLDRETGAACWRIPVDLPVFGSPTVAGEHVFFGLGNGDLLSSDDKPAGAVLCVRAQDGAEVWRFNVPDAVHSNVKVDARFVYFSSRDHHVYCLSRRDGQLRWKENLGSPVVTATALTFCDECGTTSHVYAAASRGRVVCFDANSGHVNWTFDVAKHSQAQPQLLSSPALILRKGDHDGPRRLYFGAGLDSLSNSAAVLYCFEDQARDP